jgi:hypothetical protein
LRSQSDKIAGLVETRQPRGAGGQDSEVNQVIGRLFFLIAQQWRSCAQPATNRFNDQTPMNAATHDGPKGGGFFFSVWGD